MLKRRTCLWPGVWLLLLCLSLLVSMPGALPAFARSRSGPGPITPGTIQALQRALHKQIHVTHTGTKRPPMPPTRPKPGPTKTPHVQPAYNNVGVTDRTTRRQGDMDDFGRSYSSQALQDIGVVPGGTVTSQNVTYTWPAVPPGQPDNYQAAGQVIPVTTPVGAATLGVLGASSGGPSSGTAILTYTTGSPTSVTLELTDWWSGTAAAGSGNQLIATMSTIDSPAGTRKGTYALYSVTLPVDPNRTLQSLTLPSTVSQGEMHVYAVGVGGPAFNNPGISDDSSPKAGNFDGAGNSYSTRPSPA